MQISGDRVPCPPQHLVPIPEALWISQIENSRCKVFLVYIIIYLLHFLSIILALAHLPFARTLYCRQTVTRTVRIVLPIAFYALFTSSSSAVGLLVLIVLDGCAQLDPNHSLWTISPQIKSLFRSTLCLTPWTQTSFGCILWRCRRVLRRRWLCSHRRQLSRRDSQLGGGVLGGWPGAAAHPWPSESADCGKISLVGTNRRVLPHTRRYR